MEILDVSLIFDGQDLPEILSTTKRFLLDNKKTLIIVKVKGKSDPKAFLEAGFIPRGALFSDFEQIRDELIARYVDKLNEDEMKFWRIDITDPFGIENFSDYVYANIEGWKEYAQKEAVSLPLFLFAPDLLYASGRPKTDMAMFRQPTSILFTGIVDQKDPIGPGPVGLVSPVDLAKNILTTSNEVIPGIPVTRYAPGMSKGLYYYDGDDDGDDDPDPGDFCGTFYYHEPESTTYLTYQTFRIYRNKYTAIRELYKEFSITKPISTKYFGKRDFEYFDFSEQIPGKIPGKYPKDLKMTPMEFAHFFFDKNPLIKEKAERIPQRKYYMGHLIGLYGLEDIYDQDICKMASEHGIDIIVLTHMVGRHQVVTEVLDTRDRLASFDNLSYYAS